MARGPVTDSAILEHCAKHVEEHRDKGNDHQEQDERDAAALDDCLETRGTVVVAIHTKRGNGTKDGGEDPCDDVRDDARQKLGKNRGAEQLAQVSLIGLPDLLE